MGWLDKYDRFKDVEPDSKKVAHYLFITGIFLIGGTILVQIMIDIIFKSFSLNWDESSYIQIFLIVIGALIILAAKGIEARKKWGKRLAQILSVMIFLVAISPLLMDNDIKMFSVNFHLYITILIAGALLYNWIKFLERLPVQEILSMAQQIKNGISHEH